MRRKTLMKFLAMGLCGGTVFQATTTGCGTLVAPILANTITSIIVDTVLSFLTRPA